MKRRDLERHLRQHGARFDRHGAKHDWWISDDGRATIPRHNEIKPAVARAICAQLGVAAPPNPR